MNIEYKKLFDKYPIKKKESRREYFDRICIKRECPCASPRTLEKHYKKYLKVDKLEPNQILNNIQKIAANHLYKNNQVKQIENKVLKEEGWEVKSKWQNSKGEWLYSYRKDKSTDVIEEFKKFKEEFLSEIPKNKKSYSYHNSKNKPTIALEICTPDLHFGKGDIQELHNNAMRSTLELLSQALVSYNIEKIILPIGNDGLNSEGMTKATTKGTPQEESVPWHVSFKAYWNFLVQQIDLLVSVAPVEVLVIDCNHSSERGVYIGEVLEARYENNVNVQINNEVTPRKYVQYGKVLIGFDHGDTIKGNDLPLIMATEKPHEWASTEFREWHLGHLHKEMIDEIRGVKVRHLPSISVSDTYHLKHGYEQMRCSQAFCWEGNTGLKSILQYNL